MKSRLLVAGIFLAFAVPGAAQAATPTKPIGITLSPFQKAITINPSDVEQTFDLTLTNNTHSIQELTLQARDFGTLNDTGGVLLEGSTEKYAQKYGLLSWLQIGTDTVVLNPDEQRAVPVTIQNREDLQPGGHYGAVVASVTSLDDKKSNRVLVNQQILSLLFVTKTGGEKYDLKLNSINHNGNWLHPPNVVTLRFQNPGNVHVVPRGLVRLKNASGTVVSSGIINSESSFVLPETLHDITVPLTKTSSQLPLPGPYRIEVEYHYDGLEVTAKKSLLINFISLPTYFFAAVIVIGGIYGFRRYRAHSK